MPGRTSRTQIANRSLIPRCVQRQHTAAWRPARVNLVAKQQFTGEGGGCKRGLHCCPHPWQSFVIITSRLSLPGLELLILFFLSINSFLRCSELSFQLSVDSALSDAPSVLFDCVVTVFNSVFSDSKTCDYVKSFCAFCCRSCWNFQRSAKVQGEFFSP